MKYTSGILQDSQEVTFSETLRLYAYRMNILTNAQALFIFYMQIFSIAAKPKLQTELKDWKIVFKSLNMNNEY